jgi:hypothetical protein
MIGEERDPNFQFVPTNGLIISTAPQKFVPRHRASDLRLRARIRNLFLRPEV